MTRFMSVAVFVVLLVRGQIVSLCLIPYALMLLGSFVPNEAKNAKQSQFKPNFKSPHYCKMINKIRKKWKNSENRYFYENRLFWH